METPDGGAGRSATSFLAAIAHTTFVLKPRVSKSLPETRSNRIAKNGGFRCLPGSLNYCSVLFILGTNLILARGRAIKEGEQHLDAGWKDSGSPYRILDTS